MKSASLTAFKFSPYNIVTGVEYADISFSTLEAESAVRTQAMNLVGLSGGQPSPLEEGVKFPSRNLFVRSILLSSSSRGRDSKLARIPVRMAVPSTPISCQSSTGRGFGYELHTASKNSQSHGRGFNRGCHDTHQMRVTLESDNFKNLD